MIIVCLVGLNSSGKDTVAEILEEKGFHSMALSDILRKMAKERGVADDAEALFDMIEGLKKNLGEGFLGKALLEEFKKKGWEKACAVGLRRWGEYLELKKADKCVLIYVASPVEKRFERCVKRNRKGDKISREDFDRYDKKLGSVGLDRLKSEADFIINNSEGFEKLKKLITDLLPHLC